MIAITIWFHKCKMRHLLKRECSKGENKRMKKVKIGFVGFWPNFNPDNNFFTNMLREDYDVEIAKNPDFLFYSVFSKEYLKYDCVRIFYTGECIIPDFNLCDYAMGGDFLTFGDRYLRLPHYLLYSIERVGEQRVQLAEKWYDSKTEFCSFVYSNAGADRTRMQLFEKVNNYRLVNSGGRYCNTVGNPVDDKLQFEKKHRFSIACENSSYPGYCTEKLVQAFQAHTIPIYWGDPLIGRVFNEEAFINCHSYESLEAVVDRVRELDENREQCIQILKQPIWNPGFTPQEQLASVKAFLASIVDQSIDGAKRRNDSFFGQMYEKKAYKNGLREDRIRHAHEMLRDVKKKFR